MHYLGLGLRIHALVHLLTYLLTYTVGSENIKPSNISETVEDKAKVRPTTNGLYKVVYGLSIAAKMYDLE